MKQPATLHIPFRFRWPVVQTDERSIEVLIPTGGSTPVLDPRFVEEQRLSDAEIDRASTKVLESIAILPA